MRTKSKLIYMPVVTVEQIMRFREEAMKIEQELIELKAKGIPTATFNDKGQCVAVSMQDEEHRILSVIWEYKPTYEQRSFPGDIIKGHEDDCNGDYINRCGVCKEEFQGHKRRLTCRSCL